MRTLMPQDASDIPARAFRVEFSDRPQFIVNDAMKFLSDVRAKIEYASHLAAKDFLRDGGEL